MPCVALGYNKLYRAAIIQQRADKKALKLAKKSTIQALPLSIDAAPLSVLTTTLLKDGDCIQIRPFRPRPAAKLSRAAVRKSARIIKQIVKQNRQKLKQLASAPSTSAPITPNPAKIIAPAPKPITPAILAKPIAPPPAPAIPNFSAHFRRPSRADLINAESRLGSTIFGPVPAGRRREFFHDRNNIWIWHESWTDTENGARELTVRYEVRPSGVYKKLAAGKYFKLEGDELDNFRKAARVYLRLIKQYIYHLA